LDFHCFQVQLVGLWNERFGEGLDEIELSS